MDTYTMELEQAMTRLHTVTDILEEASMIRDEILPAMAALRTVTDEAETLTASKYWPYPSYGELLFSVK